MSLYDDASLIMYPSGYKEDKIYSLKPTDGSGDFNFSRASTATRVNAEGLIEEMPYNLLTYSEQFDNAAWDKFDTATITANATNSPIGTLTADKLIPSIVADSHGVLQSIVGSPQSFSVYAKAAGYSTIVLLFTVHNARATFDLSNGTITETDGTVIASVENVGNGWYRCAISTTLTDHNQARIYAINGSTWDDRNIAGNGTSGVYLWGAQLNSGSTAKPYFPTTDRLNVPRIDYTGGGCGSLLLEPQRTNLKLYSEQFDNGYWAKFSCSITANDTTSPDGTTNGDKIVGTAGTFAPVISRNSGATAGAAYTLSIFAKKGGYSFIYLKEGSVSNGIAWFDLENGVVGTKQNGITSSKITDYGQDWYRCEMTFNQSGTTNRTRIGVSNVDNVESFTNNGTSGAYLYGAQFEQGSYATSYIPTASATATRIKDTSSTSGLSGVINSTEGVLYVEAAALANDSSQRFISLGDGTINNRIILGYNNASNGIIFFIRVGGTLVVNIISTIDDVKNCNKLAVKWKENDFSIWANGVEIGSDLSGVSFASGVLDNFNFLDADGTTEPFYGKVKNLMVFPSALTDTDLETLTTL